MSVLLLFSAFLSLFFAGLVALKKNRTYSDNLLTLWFFFTSAHLSLVYLQHYNAAHNYPFPWIIGTDISLIVVHPIWLFVYILSVIRPESKNIKILFHLVPLLVLNLILFKTHYSKSSAEKIRSFEAALEGTGYINKEQEYSIFAVICTALAYLLVSHFLLRKHKNDIKNLYSNLEGIDLKWIRVLLYSIGLVIVINASLEWIRNYTDLLPTDSAIFIGLIFVMGGITYVGIHGIRQTSIFTDSEEGEQKPNRDDETEYENNSTDRSFTIRYEKISDEDFKKLTQIMDNEKPFLDAQLSLAMLAKKMQFAPRHLSHLINLRAGKNFFDFVNSYRVEEFKQRIKQSKYKNFTLLSIAYDCGFYSKATFNRVFKLHTGQTPSQYFKNSK